MKAYTFNLTITVNTPESDPEAAAAALGWVAQIGTGTLSPAPEGVAVKVTASKGKFVTRKDGTP